MSSSIPIPKFGSFKPKVLVEEETKPIGAPKDSEHRSLSHKGHRHHHHHRHHRSKSRERSQKEGTAVQPQTVISEDDAAPLFVEDRQGDVQNLVYGSIHRYSVPAFHRVGAGSVLGAKKDMKIDRTITDDKVVVLNNWKDGIGSQREKYVFARNEKKSERLLRIRSGNEDEAAGVDNLDFIALQISKLRKRPRTGSDSRSSSEEDSQHYRSIEGKAKANVKPLDEALEWVSESDSSDPESGRVIKVDEVLRKKNIELSRMVDEHPQDVDAWIALINHQDNLLGLANGSHRKATNAERRSTADIKLHLYEKALTKVGSSLSDRERLLLGMMVEGAKLWDFKTQSERWEKISQENLDSILLWKQYLDFHQSNFSAFRYEEVRNIYNKRIKLLKDTIADGRRETDHMVLYEHLIYTTLRATLYIREAGYSELSIAIWQALLELNFMDPTGPSNKGSRLEDFQEFWDNEVLRIGEEGAKGWRHFNSDTEAPDGKIDENISSEHLDADGIFDGWAAAEKLRATASIMPARTLDDTTEDDPYRVILWSDIEAFMIDLSEASVQPQTGCLLLNAFLIFCRLPPLATSEDLSSRQWWLDSFIRADLVDCSKAWMQRYFLIPEGFETSSMGPTSSNITDRERHSPFQSPLQNFAASSDTLFPNEHWVRYLQPWCEMFEAEGPIPYLWLRNTLRSLLQTNRTDSFLEYYLAFEFCNEPQDIKRTAKRILKENPQNLKLYNAYAMIEWTRGNEEISTNVFSAALGMCSSSPEINQIDAIILWKSWTWALLGKGDGDGALRVLLGITNGTSSNLNTIDISSPAILLKTKQHLSSGRDYFLSSGSLTHAIIHTECLALLEYLSSNLEETSSRNQGDISSALYIFDRFSEVLIARGHKGTLFHENLLQSVARLLYHHIRSGPFRPAFIRDRLARDLSLFPRNTIFLSLYAWNESSLRIDHRVRAILLNTVLTEVNDNLISRLFAIHHELLSGNVYSTNSAFDKAVTSLASSSNPGLWRLYLLFCLKSRPFREKAKEVFYRAVRACPWSKDLFMLAFTELKGVGGMGTEELAAVYRVLGEKELRVHVDIEENIEELQGREGD